MIALTLAAAAPRDVPVIPGADEARRWAAEELARTVYQDAKPGLGAQVLSWLKHAIADFLNGLGSLGGTTGLLVAVCVLVLAIIAAVLLVRPRLNRRAAQGPAVFDGPAALSAGRHRELARAAVERGDLATAVLEQFRAIVRAGEERGAASAAPGLTAVEMAGGLQLAFPHHGPALARAAELFNAVRYGHAEPSRAMYNELTATDAAVAATRPLHPDGGFDGAAGSFAWTAGGQ